MNLLEICAAKDNHFTKLKPLVEDLTPLYIEARYPEFIGTITQTRARRALVAAKKISKFVKEKLKYSN